MNKYPNKFPDNHAEERRSSGLIVPFRSMPRDGDHQGTLGDESENFLTIMQRAGYGILHDLPVTPAGAFNCPYSSISTMAIDSQRINVVRLAETGDITIGELDSYQNLVSSGDAGYGIKQEKEKLLKSAFMNFDNFGNPKRQEAFAKWRDEEADWLDSYAAFEILKDLRWNKDKQWQDWGVGKDYDPKLVDGLKASYGQEFSEICYMQWVAEEQTLHYIEFAKQLGIKVWGDVPFYTGECDVWANREIFNLAPNGRQLNQGGAPPSDSSITGQNWGNATYKVDPKNNPIDTEKAVDWWVKRLKRAHKLVGGKIKNRTDKQSDDEDEAMVRLDHFIGQGEPYVLSADATDGIDGWREDGIGEMLFSRLVNVFGDNLPFIPEDLGDKTEKTTGLQARYRLPTTALAVRGWTKHLTKGIEVYDESLNNPDKYTERTVGFVGNHDSPTLIQALDGLRQTNPRELEQYIEQLRQQFPESGLSQQSSDPEIARLEMQRVNRSLARCVFVGIWDVLERGPEARYNVPSTITDKNWSWGMDNRDVAQFERDVPYLRWLNESSDRT